MNLRYSRDRIKLARFVSKLPLIKCSELGGIPLGTLKKWEKSEDLTQKAADRLQIMFAKLGVSVQSTWLLSGLGELPFRVDDLDSKLNNRSSSYHELDFFKQMNNTKKVIDIQIQDDYSDFINSGDLLAGTQETRRSKLLNKFCIVLTKSGYYKVGFLKDYDASLSQCLLDSNHIDFKEIALVKWIRKK